jgi:hypothetical protein
MLGIGKAVSQGSVVTRQHCVCDWGVFVGGVLCSTQCHCCMAYVVTRHVSDLPVWTQRVHPTVCTPVCIVQERVMSDSIVLLFGCCCVCAGLSRVAWAQQL